MNAVIGMSRILMESHLTHDLHDCAETIESSGNYILLMMRGYQADSIFFLIHLNRKPPNGNYR